VEFRENRYKVKKGEIVGGCQAVAGRDAAVFDDPDTFIAHRFVGDEGRALMKHVLWSNGPGDARASAANKQCAAVDLVPFLAQAFLASLFLRYDSFTALPPVVRGSNVTVCINSLNSRSDYDGGGGGAV
jgi:cytochrome P450